MRKEWTHREKWRARWFLSAMLVLLVALAACGKPQEACAAVEGHRCLDASRHDGIRQGTPRVQHDERARVPRSSHSRYPLPGLRGCREQPLRSSAGQGTRHRLLLRERGMLSELPRCRRRPSRQDTGRFMFWKAGCLPGSRRGIPWRRSSGSRGVRSSRSGPRH